MKLKAIHIVAILILLAIIVSGYFLLQQVQKPPEEQLAKFGYYAETDLNLSLAQFSKCVDTEKYRQDVLNDYYDGRTYGIQATPTFSINGRELVGFQPFDKFKTIIDEELASPSIGTEIRTGTNPVRGSPNATVTIVEFSDYQCPFCAKVEDVVKQVMQQYAGKVKIYYRDYPLNLLNPAAHKFSVVAAEASRCAGEQGKFWEYHDFLFEKQQEWSGG